MTSATPDSEFNPDEFFAAIIQAASRADHLSENEASFSLAKYLEGRFDEETVAVCAGLLAVRMRRMMKQNIEHAVDRVERNLFSGASKVAIVEGIPEIRFEDNGSALIATVSDIEDEDDGVFVRVMSWFDEPQPHPIEAKIRDKRVRVTVEVLDGP